MMNIFLSQRVFSLFFTAIFLWSSGAYSAPGFLADTLVDTPNGYIPIQNLKAGDSVYSRNPETGDLTRTKVARIKTRMIEHFARITITPKGSLLTSEDQEFYNGDASDKAKISELVLHEARYLRKDDQIATISRFEKVSKLEITNWWLCQAYVYCIELQSHHNFYVSLRWTNAKATKPSYASFLVHDGIKDIGMIESAAQAAFSGTSSIVGPGIISVGVGAGVTAAHAVENVATFAKENPKLTMTVLTVGAICFFGVGLVMLPALASSGGRGGFSTSGGYTEYDYRLDRVKYELEWREQEEYRLSKRELKKADKRMHRELIELQKQMIQKEKQKHNNNNNNNNNNDDVIIIEAPRQIQNQKTETLEEKKQETIQVEEPHSKDSVKNTEEIVSEILSVLNSETSEMGSVQSVDAIGKIVDAAVVVATAGAVWVTGKFKDKRDEIDKQIDDALNRSVEPKACTGVNSSHSNKEVNNGSYVLAPVTSSSNNSKSESSQSVSTENVSVSLESQQSKFIEIQQDLSQSSDNFVVTESVQKNEIVFHDSVVSQEADALILSHNVKIEDDTDKANYNPSVHHTNKPTGISATVFTPRINNNLVKCNGVTYVRYSKRDKELNKIKREQEKRDNPRSSWYSVSYKKSKTPGKKSPWYSISYKSKQRNNNNNNIPEVRKTDNQVFSENIEQIETKENLVPQSEIYEHSDNVIEVKEASFVQDEESCFSVNDQKTENAFPFQHSQKVLEIIEDQRNHKKSLTEKIVDLLPQSFLKANDQDSDFVPFVLKEPREESYKFVIESSPSKNIEIIPVQERDPAENIIITPVVEHDHADDILDNPITQNDLRENILVTPISEQQSSIICEIPIIEQNSSDICNTKRREELVEKKERKVNVLEKQEAVKMVEGRYVKVAKHTWQVVGKGLGFGDKGEVEYIEWDQLHKEWEAYGKGSRPQSRPHLGAVDPKTGKIYKPAVHNRIMRWNS